MEYTGHTLGADVTIQTIDVGSVSPKEFFDRYIATRTPVVLRGLPEYLGCTAQWNNSYLRSAAGKVEVTVEKRQSVQGRFGQGTTTKMPFNSLLDLFEQGSTLHYLTTQPTEDEVEQQHQQHQQNSTASASASLPPAAAAVLRAVPEAGLPPLAMAPALQLLEAEGGVPARPPLLGGLVPANINIWMGKCIEGSSSGLHHDYHDNLYVLLRGRKRFRLHSPNDAGKMYTVGEVAKVHQNGRINYKGAPLTDSAGILLAKTDDEAPAAAAIAVAAADALRRRLAAAAAAAEEGGSSAEDAAEDEMDAALEAALDAGIGSGVGDDYDIDYDEGEEFSEEEDLVDGNGDGGGGGGMDGSAALWSSGGGGGGAGEGMGDDDDADDADDAPGSLVDDGTGTGVLLWEPGKDAAADADNAAGLSKRRRLDREPARTDIAKEFPLYRTAAVTECEIEEGSMLYLPAGWFHEVLSFSTIDASKANGTAAASSNGRAAAAEPSVHEHLALNYWVHPPDTASFDAPYSSSYWTDEWKLRTAAT
eukprot:gene5374-26831_t